MFDQTVKNDETYIEWFSREIYRSHHPSKTKIGGVRLYFREGLTIKRRTDLELLPEIIITEIRIARKKIILGTMYRNPSQNSEEFETFIDSLQQTINKMNGENSHCMILTGNLNYRSSM